MADPLSMTASIVAVIQLAGALSTFTNGYIGGFRRASSERRRLLDEFASLGQILQHLSSHNDANAGALQGLAGPLESCRLELEAVAAKLRPRKGARGVWIKLKWPLEEAEMMQVIGRVERYKTLFHFALTADHS